MSYKQEVLRLRSEGKTYDEICNELGCTKATVAWHASEKVKTSYRKARQRNRRKFATKLKMLHGGKCSLCGYAKCLDALHFHHKHPETKNRVYTSTGNLTSVVGLSITKNQKTAINEAKKCELICANCHAEIHSKL